MNLILGFALTAAFLLLVSARVDAGRLYSNDPETFRADRARHSRAFDALMEQYETRLAPVTAAAPPFKMSARPYLGLLDETKYVCSPIVNNSKLQRVCYYANAREARI